MDLFQFATWFFSLFLLLQACSAIPQTIGQISPGFKASEMDYIEYNGQFLLSNNLGFSLCFSSTPYVGLFSLVIVHMKTNRIVWTADRGSMITSFDRFVFDNNGTVYLESQKGVLWSTNTTGATAMALQDSGNLVVIGGTGEVLWQSFSHPTDTLLVGQDFLKGMKLRSDPTRNNLVQCLEIISGNLVLYADYGTPQIYWSAADDSRKTKTNARGNIHSASLASNALIFYDQNKFELGRFNFTKASETNATWSAVLDSNGYISFYSLHIGITVKAERITVPPSSCSTPEPCDPYSVCYIGNQCQCPSSHNSQFNCKPRTISTCNGSESSVDLTYVGDKLDYFALGFVAPSLKSDVHACQQACLANCSCVVLFFERSSGNCFLFNQIGSFRSAEAGSAGYISYVKVLSDGGGQQILASGKSRNGRYILVLVIIAIATVLITAGLIFASIRYHHKSKTVLETSPNNLEDDNLLDSLYAMPVRFSYSDLHKATNVFSIKLGEGGFGSVYLAVLPDGTLSAVKQLEGIGQGMKEFKAEVGLIGSINHVHLVQLKGFCAEGPHRLLVYEYMGKGSLDRWIFKSVEDNPILDWDTRFYIAVGTAKALAYLHEECDVKIVHCDIKPENVLLDDKYVPKVSDFGLVKLMDREQSLVCTQLRGTRGYLAPEWIFNLAISEKSDVYSYGMLLLEIIGGRKNSDPTQSPEKVYLPSYAFKMMEEGKITAILDSKLETYESDERVATAVKVALWCIQEDMHLRPSMTKVVQMLEGCCAVSQPPNPSTCASKSSSGNWGNESSTPSSKLINYYSDRNLSAARLSEPR